MYIPPFRARPQASGVRCHRNIVGRGSNSHVEVESITGDHDADQSSDGQQPQRPEEAEPIIGDLETNTCARIEGDDQSHSRDHEGDDGTEEIDV